MEEKILSGGRDRAEGMIDGGEERSCRESGGEDFSCF